jgi:hypothetical protein
MIYDFFLEFRFGLFSSLQIFNIFLESPLLTILYVCGLFFVVSVVHFSELTKSESNSATLVVTFLKVRVPTVLDGQSIAGEMLSSFRHEVVGHT